MSGGPACMCRARGSIGDGDGDVHAAVGEAGDVEDARVGEGEAVACAWRKHDGGGVVQLGGGVEGWVADLEETGAEDVRFGGALVLEGERCAALDSAGAEEEAVVVHGDGAAAGGAGAASDGLGSGFSGGFGGGRRAGGRMRGRGGRGAARGGAGACPAG